MGQVIIALLIYGIISTAIYSLVWAAILMLWAKKVANVESAGYGNSYKVSFVGWSLFWVVFAILMAFLAGSAADGNAGPFKIIAELGAVGVAVIFIAIGTGCLAFAAKKFYGLDDWPTAAKAVAIVPILQVLPVLVMA